jgi:hypothetical protein
MATRDGFKRHLPGRLVGVSHDAEVRPGFRLALQTREQHIRRDKATSNICTAQVVLAVMAAMYAVYHGPRGLRSIAQRVHDFASKLAGGLRELGFEIAHEDFFDTIRVELGDADTAEILQRAERVGCNLRQLGPHAIGISLDETTSDHDIETLMSVFRGTHVKDFADDELELDGFPIPEAFVRQSDFLTHPVFNSYHTETEMLRYLRRLEARDLSLTTSMIPLGSCTMKLNATAEMFPVSWPEFAKLHPFAPESQATGYRDMCEQLEQWLAEITGFAAVSLQPNAGSQGEYAGLLAIREYHKASGEGHRRVGLLPQSVVTPDGYRAKGRDAEQALQIIADAEALEDAGCAALIVEAVPAEVAELMTARVGIPVIGIGAGAATNGQVLVFHDLLGLGEGHVAKFVERYADGRAMLEDGARRWTEDVRAGRFPRASHSYSIAPEEIAMVRERLGG